VIEARNLTKRFGRRTAIDGVSLRVARGEVVGFLGPNGAGKTTTLRVLAGVFPPTSGQALIDGHDLVADPLGARRVLGYAPEHPALHGEMTVRAELNYVAALRDLLPGARQAAVERALERTGLRSFADRRIGILSRGTRQRVGLAVALLGDPPAVLLDEPTAGMDPTQGADMRRLIRSLGTGHAVFVSSHALADVETLCDRVVVLHHGRILAEGAPAELAARLRPVALVDVDAAAPYEALETLLAAVPGVRHVERLPAATGHARCRVEAERGYDLRAVLAARVAAAGWPLYALTPVEASLEDAFRALVSAPESAA
jgi:gliding motility-associated transport system ATP-binding protein